MKLEINNTRKAGKITNLRKLGTYSLTTNGFFNAKILFLLYYIFPSTIQDLNFYLSAAFFFLSSVIRHMGLPWWLSGKESACQYGYAGSISGSGRSPALGNDNPLQYSGP